MVVLEVQKPLRGLRGVGRWNRSRRAGGLSATPVFPHRNREPAWSGKRPVRWRMRSRTGGVAHTVVLSIDEKSQIQALDRTQPGLPLKPGKCGTMTHDYKRNGTTTLFAALDVLHGTVVGRCMPNHRHQEFVKFLNAVERAVPVGKVIHAVVDNYATHKHPKVLEWLADNPRWVFHFTPTSGSWLNAVENFFSVLTRRAIRRGVFNRSAHAAHHRARALLHERAELISPAASTDQSARGRVRPAFLPLLNGSALSNRDQQCPKTTLTTTDSPALLVHSGRDQSA